MDDDNGDNLQALLSNPALDEHIEHLLDFFREVWTLTAPDDEAAA